MSEEIKDQSWALPSDAIVVLGAFNPDILNPFWVKRNIFPHEKLSETQFQIAGIGGTPIMHRSDDLYWEPARNRIRVLGRPERTGEFASKVLKKLPHTPVQAAGINFVRTGELNPESAFGFDVDSNAASRIMSGELAASSLSITTTRRDSASLSLRIEKRPSDPGQVVLHFNFHLDATAEENEKRSEQLSVHVLKAVDFAEEADQIARELLRG